MEHTPYQEPIGRKLEREHPEAFHSHRVRWAAWQAVIGCVVSAIAVFVLPTLLHPAGAGASAGLFLVQAGLVALTLLAFVYVIRERRRHMAPAKMTTPNGGPGHA